MKPEVAAIGRPCISIFALALAACGGPEQGAISQSKAPVVRSLATRTVEPAASESGPVVMNVVVNSDLGRASESSRGLTGSRPLNEVLARHGVRSYRAGYPYSKIQRLLDVYKLTCIGCSAEALSRDLEATRLFSEIEVQPTPIALGYGNPGGYDPADYMWTAHAQDWMWSLVKTDADLAWNMTRGDPNVLIAVVDNGFDVNHPELITKMSPIDPSTGNALFANSHGTSTAGVAAGETADTGGTPNGVMPSVGFHSGVQGFMWGGTSAAHYAALAMNADVISISWFYGGYWGCNPNFGGTDQLAIQEILDSGTVIVAAAANGLGHCGGLDVFPFSAIYDERIIVVTSTDDQDQHDHGAGTHSHYPRVDLAAPGYGVMVATLGSGWPYYGDGNGTSFAAPFVAGTTALMKSVNSCLKPADVQEILKTSTDPIVDAASFPNGVGTGRVNVNRAVAVAQSLDYACPQGGYFDGANCQLGAAPAGTTAFVWGGNYYYTALPGNICPYPGSWYDGANCFVYKVPEGVNPFIWANHWYYSNCASTGWTDWLDRDNPSGTGDWEQRISHIGVCAQPLAIQCRATNGTYWTQNPDVNVICDRDQGLICRNSDQVDGTCEDYEVRFYCP